jgi:hypothetical protein
MKSVLFSFEFLIGPEENPYDATLLSEYLISLSRYLLGKERPKNLIQSDVSINGNYLR